MEESFKTRIIIILSIFTIILLLGNISSCGSVSKNKNAFKREMATRLDLEEKVSKFGDQRKFLDERVGTLQQELAKEKQEHQATKNSLIQEQLVSQSLKQDLQKVSELNKTLEDDLKEALVKIKATSKK